MIKAAIKRLREAHKLELLGIAVHAMANFGEEITGIPGVVVNVIPQRGSHWARLKVAKKGSGFVNKKHNFTVSISDKPQVMVGQSNVKNICDTQTLQKILKWVEQNESALLRFWTDNEYLTTEFFSDLKKVK